MSYINIPNKHWLLHMNTLWIRYEYIPIMPIGMWIAAVPSLELMAVVGISSFIIYTQCLLYFVFKCRMYIICTKNDMRKKIAYNISTKKCETIEEKNHHSESEEQYR